MTGINAPMIAALMARVAEFTPEQIGSLDTLLQHSQKNIDTGQLVDMGDKGVASSYTIGVGDDKGERLVPSAWDGAIRSPEDSYRRAFEQRDDWPLFPAGEWERGERAANLAHQLMMYQKKRTP